MVQGAQGPASPPTTHADSAQNHKSWFLAFVSATGWADTIFSLDLDFECKRGSAATGACM